jgi:hypothetical protein
MKYTKRKKKKFFCILLYKLIITIFDSPENSEKINDRIEKKQKDRGVISVSWYHMVHNILSGTGTKVGTAFFQVVYKPVPIQTGTTKVWYQGF